MAMPKVLANFTTSLASKITSVASSLTLSRSTDPDGTTLSGQYILTLDEGTSTEEHMLVTLTGAAGVIDTRGLSKVDMTTSVAGNKFAHDRGGEVKVTNAVLIRVISELNGSTRNNVLTGTSGLVWRVGDGTDSDIFFYAQNADGTKPFVKYDSATSKWLISNDGTNSYDPQAGGSGVTAGLGIQISGGAVSTKLNASGLLVENLGAGSDELGIATDTANALSGSSGTPSSSNKFITEADVRLVLPGVITPYAGFTAPSGWLLCDGSAVSRSTYATLWALINPSLGTATMTIASPGVVSKTAHGLVLDDKIYFTTTGALPTGVTANTIYYVISAGLTADAFQFSATKGGSAVNTSGSQSGTHTLYRSPYGLGDGSTTFNVPSLKGVVPVGRDSAQTEFNAVGETGGAKTHTLTTDEMPAHTHQVAYNFGGTGGSSPLPGSSSTATQGQHVTGSTGGGGAHNNLQPYIALNYIIKT